MKVFSRLARYSVCVVVLVAVLAPGQVRSQDIQLSVLGEYKTGVFDASSAEIVAHEPASQRLFVVRGDAAVMDVVSIANPAAPVLAGHIDLASLWSAFGGANSVAVRDGVVAVAVQADPKTDPGRVYFFDTDGQYLSHVTVGALPDMLTFSKDGMYVLVANEGEPNDSYTIDPEGSVSVIDISTGVATATVMTAGFTAWNGQEAALRASGVRIYGPGATAAQDLEPEYITTEGNLAWVTLQENNALAKIEISSATVLSITSLGTKDHSAPGMGFDPTDRDGVININSFPVRGMYQPDAIASVTIGEQIYLVTANEGDARDYDAYSEESRMRSATVDPSFPNLATLRDNAVMGRLNITTATGDTDNDGDLDELYAVGARSFSIWDANGVQVWDSGEDFERITAAAYPANFNAGNDENDFEGRSDNKGPEPEAVAIGSVCGQTYAFIGLERIGGIMVYDISDPTAPVFQQYINNRDFSQTPGPATVNTVGDLGPEGLIFIPASDSPNGMNLLVCASEVSGSVTVFSVLNTTAPVLTAGLTLTKQVNASKGDFLVSLQAEDGCDPDPVVSAWMNIPQISNPVMVYTVAAKPKVKFDPSKGSITVEAPQPMQFWADILAAGGIPVTDGDEFEFDQLPNYGKVEFTFSPAGSLQKIKAAQASMTAVAVDASNSSVSLTVGALFPAPKTVTELPASVTLGQNYPNPFNPSTTITYDVQEAGDVRLDVHDMDGRLLRTLVDAPQQVGSYSVLWDGRAANGAVLPSGTYFYTLRSGGELLTRRMMLTK